MTDLGLGFEAGSGAIRVDKTFGDTGLVPEVLPLELQLQVRPLLELLVLALRWLWVLLIYMVIPFSELVWLLI